MTDKPVEKVIKNAIKLLREIYPQSVYLYFPLLSTALVWAVRRPEEWASLMTTDKLITKDLSCGFYHYLQSQVLTHLQEFKKSFERAVLAWELGLPTEQILRDNDNQIVYCYRELKKRLQPEQWRSFEAVYLEGVKRWEWKGPEMPTWRAR